jgi:hypothetical protein
VLLGAQGEGVHVDTDVGGNILVVLEGLDQVEVSTIALSKAVVAVELELGGGDGVDATVREVDPVAVAIGDDAPDQLLARMVKVELDAVGGAGDGLVTSELQLLDQVLVRELSEAAALISVQEDVVNPQGDILQVTADGTRGSAVGLGLEVDVDLDLVVLQSNEGHVYTLPFGIFLRLVEFLHSTFLRD